MYSFMLTNLQFRFIFVAEHKPSSIQMMCGVNLMSCLFTSASLVQQGGFFYSLSFASRVFKFKVAYLKLFKLTCQINTAPCFYHGLSANCHQFGFGTTFHFCYNIKIWTCCVYNYYDCSTGIKKLLLFIYFLFI